MSSVQGKNTVFIGMTCPRVNQYYLWGTLYQLIIPDCKSVMSYNNCLHTLGGLAKVWSDPNWPCTMELLWVGLKVRSKTIQSLNNINQQLPWRNILIEKKLKTNCRKALLKINEAHSFIGVAATTSADTAKLSMEWMILTKCSWIWSLRNNNIYTKSEYDERLLCSQ
jgi:hypothetical protein